ncbi:MAG: DNA translocase FtsK 4TM domain-containing protein [Alphaproteobacteria bacterium]|nr:DNA translocase FtsK 4TM domain-containing protein [Alphaproteobacteria bacterium]
MGKKINRKEEQKSWIYVLWCKTIGILLMVLPILVYAALADYNATDPSFNKVTTSSQEVHNFLGLFGATAADAVLSTFGISLIIFLLVPVFWGCSLYRYGSFPEYKTRIFAWFVGVLSLSCFTDLTLSEYLGRFNFSHNLTGDWSLALSRPINTYINRLNIPYNTIILEGIILFVSIISFNFSAGITYKRWFYLFKSIWRGICSFFRLFASIFRKIVNIRNLHEFKEINPRYLQSKIKTTSAMNIRMEPSFRNAEPKMSQNLHDSAAASIANSYSQYDTRSGNELLAAGSELTIEIPQSMVQNSENTDNVQNFKNKSFNPTFDFMNEQDIANQNNKKNSKNNSDYDKTAYSSAKTGFPEAKQEELLAIPDKAPENMLSKEIKEQKSTQERTVNNNINSYMLPDINLLSAPKEATGMVFDESVLKQRALQLEHVLNDFNIQGQIVKVSPGPVVTLYELEPKSGTRTARVIGLSDDIARSMAVGSVRMAVVNGKSTIGIELPNEKRQTVGLRELLEDREFTDSKNILTVALGKDIGGQHVYTDLAGMPHLLVAGTTGSGKSVGVNSMILSLLYRLNPDQCKFIMIDPKCVEFSMYNGIPHLLTPVITDPAKAVVGLKWAVQEMENRNRSLALMNVRNIVGYNKKMAEMSKSGKEMKKTVQSGFDKETGLPIYEEQVIDTSPMPYIVIVVDEMADLMLVAGKEVEAAIQRLAQMGRAVGIHLIMATQRPSVDVITGVIKANFPSRISFHVTNKFDSTTIIGEKGAEQLLGRGDMLFVASGSKPRRVHGCFVPDEEVEKVVEFIKEQGEPKYVAEVTAGELNTKDSGPVFDNSEMGGGSSEEDLYRQAVDVVRTDKKASISYVQRKLRIGYNRAANLIERMEREGVVTKQDHVGRREVIGVD